MAIQLCPLCLVCVHTHQRIKASSHEVQSAKALRHWTLIAEKHLSQGVYQWNRELAHALSLRKDSSSHPPTSAVQLLATNLGQSGAVASQPLSRASVRLISGKTKTRGDEADRPVSASTPGTHLFSRLQRTKDSISMPMLEPPHKRCDAKTYKDLTVHFTTRRESD